MQVIRTHIELDLEGALAEALAAVDMAELLSMVRLDLDQEGMEYAAQHSYFHVNGFHRLTLPLLLDTQARVRLHIWPASSAHAEQSDAHNHRWKFVSRSLYGVLENTIYEPLPESGPFFRYRHTSPTRDGSHYSFSSEGRSQLDLRQVQLLREQESYSMLPDPVHRVRNIGPAAATLVVEFPFCRPSTDVYARLPKEEGSSVRPRRHSPYEIDRLLSDVLKGIR
ncbi:MAG: hypothetical protein V9F00_17950 [Nocardioides sp.]